MGPRLDWNNRVGGAATPGQSQAVPALPPNQGETYTVQAGDILGRILIRAGLSPRDAAAVARFNNIPDPDRILAGQSLRIPTRQQIDTDPALRRAREELAAERARLAESGGMAPATRTSGGQQGLPTAQRG